MCNNGGPIYSMVGIDATDSWTERTPYGCTYTFYKIDLNKA
jgi:hypothetical protein